MKNISFAMPFLLMCVIGAANYAGGNKLSGLKYIGITFAGWFAFSFVSHLISELAKYKKG